MNWLSSPESKAYPCIKFFVKDPHISRSFMLLQEGVKVVSRIGCSVNAFLREEMGTDAEIIEKIQSIILDGKPVDDLESTVIKDGSVLALSAAMPGLVGATLRRGGAYSSFRSTITYRETEHVQVLGEGLVKIKIFNLLMSELGPGLLNRGVIIRSDSFNRFVSEQSKYYWQGCGRITLDDKPVKLENLMDAARLPEREEIYFSVSSDQAII